MVNKADQHKTNPEIEEAEMIALRGEQTSPAIAGLL